MRRFLLPMLFAAAAFVLPHHSHGAEDPDLEWTKIDETWGKIEVVAGAPIPSGLADQDKAIESAKQSAVAIAHTRLVLYILEKNKGDNPTGTADEAPAELLSAVQSVAQTAKIAKTKWDDEICWVKLVLPKKAVKEFWAQ